MLVYKCYFAGVLCMFMSVRTCACFLVSVLETIAQSQRVALGLLPRHSPFALASVYLWTKGCSETNDLAPVSQSRGTRDEKKKEVRDGEGGNDAGFQSRCWSEQESKEREMGNRGKKVQEGRGREAD